MPSSKDKRINIRLSEDDYREISQRATDAGISLSEYIRRSALREHGPVIRTDADGLRRIHTNLKRSGSLLNQCARELNTHHRPEAVEEELASALAAVSEASAEIAAFIRDARESV